MNKLEVGMYVRFNYHRVTVPIQISKIKEKHYEDIERYYYYLTDNGLVISEAQILKASHNIIDLIEVGDYVNGKKIVDVGCLINGPRKGTKAIDYYITPSAVSYLENEDIKSVITHEQIEQMEYRIGE